MRHLLLICGLSILLISIGFVSSQTNWGYYNDELPNMEDPSLSTTNFSLIDVNNSQFWRGLGTPGDIIDFLRLDGSNSPASSIDWGGQDITNIGNIDGLAYLKLDGSNANQNINISPWNLTVHSLFTASDSIYIGDIKMSDEAGILNVSKNVTAPFFEGDGSLLTNLNISVINNTLFVRNLSLEGDLYMNNNSIISAGQINATIFYGENFSGDFYCDYTNTNCYNITELVQKNNIGAFETDVIITTSGGTGVGISSIIFDYLITEIIVTPTTPTTTYRFEVVESSTGDMIDRNRIVHSGIWDIQKSHSINDQVNLSISSSSVDEIFTITIKYMNNYLA